jgi:hypothetical protein
VLECRHHALPALDTKKAKPNEPLSAFCLSSVSDSVYMHVSSSSCSIENGHVMPGLIHKAYNAMRDGALSVERAAALLLLLLLLLLVHALL